MSRRNRAAENLAALEARAQAAPVAEPPRLPIPQSRQVEGERSNRGIAEGITSGALSGAVFGGPLGLLIGAGTGLLTNRLHQSQLDAAAAEEGSRQEAISGFTREFANAYDRAAGMVSAEADPRAQEMDRAQLEQIGSRYAKGQQLLQHPDPQVRDLAVREMVAANNDVAAWLKDMESREEQVADRELARQRKLADDIAQFERDMAKIDRNELRQVQGRILQDELGRIRDANQSRGMERKATDNILAVVEAGSYERDGAWHLGPHAREQVDQYLQNNAAVNFALRVSANPTVAAANFGIQVASAAVKLATGQVLSDAERVAFLKAMDEAGEMQHQNVLDNSIPVFRKQAERFGLDPSGVSATQDFPLDERQAELRSQYGRNWSTERKAFATAEGAGGVPRGYDDLDPVHSAGDYLEGLRRDLSRLRRRPTN